MKDSILISGIAAILLAIIHILASKIKFLQGIPRSKWLSIAGGASVAYVFIHILPELEEWQRTFEESGIFEFLEHHLYLVALIGLVTFYGLERAAKLSRQSAREEQQERKASYPGIYWLHMISFTVYNAFIGYLLIHRYSDDILNLLVFLIAMGLHFLVNDYGLYEHYKRRYSWHGRWIISVGIITGWLVGIMMEISESRLAVIFAFISGGIILNVLKEELPEERKSDFWAFFSGILVYSTLLILI